MHCGAAGVEKVSGIEGSCEVIKYCVACDEKVQESCPTSSCAMRKVDFSIPDPIHGKPDLVNHPPHYTSHPSGVECIAITEHYGFSLGNAIKYIWRAGLKSGTSPLEDLKKAQWYLTREIARREQSDG